MLPSASNRAPIAICLALSCIILLAGCAVPLAPGYQVEKESLTVRFAAGTPPHLAIRADYQLKNVGTTPLDFVEVTVPGEKSFGRANFRVLVARGEVTPRAEQDTDSPAGSDESASAATLWRIPLAPALRKKQKIKVSFEYDLAATAPADPRIFATENMFYLNDSGWFPEFQEPKALFAEDITRPNPTDFTIIVPANFLVTASGQARGEKKLRAETEHHFRISKDDFDPYVLAGQYNEQRASSNGVTVAIWTLKPILAEQAQGTAAQIASAAAFYAQAFGALPKSMKSIIVADTRTARESLYTPLPGVILNWISPQKDGFHAHLVPQLPQMELAQTWFSHLITPQSDAWMLADAMSAYAFSVSSTSQNPGEEDRRRSIQELLEDYDRRASSAVEKPFTTLLPSDPLPQVLIGDARAELFFFALEDKCGRENVVHAIAHMVYALRGQQYGYNDFRAALEQECHQNLAGFFRTWLNQTGIPADFRAHYQSAAAKQ